MVLVASTSLSASLLFVIFTFSDGFAIDPPQYVYEVEHAAAEWNLWTGGTEGKQYVDRFLENR